jgi:signal transduction histidine kinase
VESECTIVSENDNGTETYEFGIVVNPFKAFDNQYYIMSLFDISDSKRRLFLEKIFFHDILNKVGSLNGFLQLIQSVSDPAKLDEYIKTLDVISQQLVSEIFFQKQLLEAENGTLEVNKELINSKDFALNLVNQIAQHKVAKDIRVELSELADSISFFSDSTLLGRVIFNMLKNAAEASKKGDLVTLNCIKVENGVILSVNNPTFMTDEVKSSIFKRSFSTKGSGRGLGTYSMKVLTEKYLKGNIYFESNKEEGTTFFVELNN